MKRICIVGSKGQLGAALVGEAQSRGFFTLGAARQPGGDIFVDLEKPETFDAVFAWKPDAILLAAGYTFVDKAESETERAAQINAHAPESIAKRAASLNVPVVFYSTDYVFDGTASGSYKETDATNPQSVYGKTKLLGETAVLATSAKNLVLRTSVVYGPDPAQKNFVYQCIKAAKEGRKLKIASDQRANPTSNLELAWASFELLLRGHTGAFNAVGPESLLRPEFGAKVCATFGLSPETLFDVLATRDMPSPAKRPLNGSLDPTKLHQTLGRSLKDPTSGLHAFKTWLATSSSSS